MAIAGPLEGVVPVQTERASRDPPDYVTIPGLLRAGRTSADIFDLKGRLVLANALSVAK